MHRGVSIGIGLKVDDKLIGFIAFSGAFHALDHLLAQVWRVARYRWGERIDIAIGAAAVALAAIAVGAGKPTIHNHLKNPVAVVPTLKPGAIVVIALFPSTHR